MANDPQPQNQQAQGFDVNGARQAGYSDDEILQHLTQTRSFDVNGAVQAGYSKPEIIDHLSQSTPAQQGTPITNKTTIGPTPKMFSLPWFKQKGLELGLGTADALPAAGATAGSIIGATGGTLGAPGPGSIAGGIGGAGVGGMGGEAAKQLLRRALGFGGPATSGEAANDITKQGLTQAGIQGVTEGLPFLAGPLKNAATTQYERALAPTTRANKAITQKIAPEMIQRGEYGSLDALAERAGNQAADVSPRLDAAYAAAPGTSGLGAGPKIVNDLEQLKGQYKVGGIPANDTAINAIEGVQNIIQRFGQDIDPSSLRKLKGIFDDPVAKAGGYAGADLATKYTLEAQKQAADSIRGIMAQASPDVAALNKEISFWLNVQRVTSASAERQTGQAGGLLKVLGPLAAGGTASMTGLHFGTAAGVEAGAATALTTMAVQAMRSPAWRTASAVLKNRFADALARGSVGDTTALLARFGIAAQGVQQENQQRSARLPWQSQQQGNQVPVQQ